MYLPNREPYHTYYLLVITFSSNLIHNKNKSKRNFKPKLHLHKI